MVAITSQVPRSEIGTERLFTAILFILLQQERKVAYFTSFHLPIKRMAAQHLVETIPFSMIAVSSLCPIPSLGTLTYINKVMLLQLFQGRRVVIIIEIACYENFGRSIQCLERIHGLPQLACHLQTIGTGSFLATSPTRSMDHKDMERVVTDEHSLSIEDVTGRTHVWQPFHTDGMMVQ